MARYKVLKSVVHSLAHSFASVMNYNRDDYVMSHLLRRAEAVSRFELYVDILRERAGPLDLLTRPVLESVHWYCRDFGRLVTNSGAALDMVAEAELRVRVTPGRRATHTRHGNGRVIATARVVDDRGRVYLGRALETYDYHGPR